ncbi:MAG: DUF5309 family protein [Chloroflexi bacterium]|jgi:hypothetical protein|nr:DUF5309 family protein [Chloroflexota bacterium]MBT3668732.1 DUF5309 family protein [Chloroflexota bacterium]MBT4002787.1 DUF5309 family protein [Chloroflexota bacterium]MBT4305433.1 DUF5309 family protein [Chloroflexota bacterium]MBT4533044.1 DUF5309 family protein [Chloroflexota bacterium]
MVLDQPKTVYSDATAQARAISDVISMIDPRDTPLLAKLGLDGAREKFKLNLDGYKIEILEDSLDPLEDAINDAAGWDGSDTEELVVDDASKFQDGYVILVEDEKLVVKNVDTTNNFLEVYGRGFGDTTAAAHADDTVIKIIGMARLEGDDADYGPIVDISAPYNYTSIFQKAIKVSGTLQAISQHGIDDEFIYQANKAVPHLLRLVERMAFYGERVVGNASSPRSAGGLGVFITDNVVAAGGAIAKSHVDSLMEEIIMDGGYPDLLVMNPRVANDLRALLDSSSFVRVSQDENKLGVDAIERVMTQYGELELVMDRWCPTDTAYVLQSDKVGFYSLRNFESYELARSGDSLKGEVVGEFSILAANDKAHGKITGITT